MIRPALLFAVFAMALVTACGGGGDTTAAQPEDAASPVVSTGVGNFAFVGFSDHAAPGNYPPPDVTKPGGTMRACNPPSLFAFISYAALPALKPMTGRWTANGTPIGEQTIQPVAKEGSTFGHLQGTAATLTAGLYTFELSIDGTPVTRARFTLAC